jgi:type VII secretion protein EccB
MAMQSRRDLLHAHRLMTQRAALALLRGEPDVPDQPLRRLNVGTFAGVLVGVIVAGIFGIWGLLFHGSPALQPEAGSVIIDKQTGADYVFCGNNLQEICPVVNYASALLQLKSSAAVTVQTVNQSELTSLQHGPLLGIPGLPPDLPTASLLIQQPWSVCSQNRFGVAGVANGEQTTTVLAGGFQPGGQSIGSTGLLLVSSAGQDWVIGNGLRMPIDATTMADLFSSTQPVSVPSVWLNAIPQGAFFQAPFITGQGSLVTSPTGAQAPVGTLFQTQSGAGVQYYVLVQGGSLSRITQTQEALIALEKGEAAPQTLSQSELNGRVSSPMPTNGLPSTVTNPVAAQQSAPLCVVFSGSGQVLGMQVETGGQMPTDGTNTDAAAGSGLVDQIALPPGKGALVKVAGSSISYILVTDGHRYAMASTAVPGYLGYNTSQAVELPAGVLDLIPTGPGFDPGQASLPVPSGG